MTVVIIILICDRFSLLLLLIDGIGTLSFYPSFTQNLYLFKYILTIIPLNFSLINKEKWEAMSGTKPTERRSSTTDYNLGGPRDSQVGSGPGATDVEFDVFIGRNEVRETIINTIQAILD